MSTPTNQGNPSEPSPGDRGASPEEFQPVPIPDHELLRCIGKGSYGRVWLARNSMGQYRAVKIVYRANFQDDVPYLRELSGIRQFEPISRSHEGFVDVLQVGINEPGGYFYYVMELGDDQTSGQTIQPAIYAAKTLREVLPAGRPLPLAECLRFGLALSLALAELHRHKLVHRDIKPSNIIFVNGVPKLADIGLVTTVGDNLSFVGTEGYVPPEGPGKPQADVYALGKVLYEASTGNDRLAFPELPTAYDAETEVERLLELNEVTLQACARNPFDRYQTAWEMHAHLLVLANGKSVKRLLSLERNLGRLKNLAVFAGALAFVLAAVLYPIYNEIRRRSEERQRHVGANVAYGNAAMAAGDNPGALTYFAEALRTDERDGKLAPLDRLRVGAVLEQCPKLVDFWRERGPSDQLAVSPDGTGLLTLPEQGDATYHSLTSGTQVSPEFAGQGFYPAGGLSPDGKLAATTSGENSGTNFVTVWEVKTRRVVGMLRLSDVIHSIRFSPDSRRVVVACDDKTVSVWNVAQQRVEFAVAHDGPVLYSDFSHDGKLIVTTSKDGTARIWNAENGTNFFVLQGVSWITHAAFSPDDRLLVTCGFDKKAWVWSVTNGIRLSSGLNHQAGINWAEFSPDGRMIVTGSWDSTVRLWSAHSFDPWESVPVLNHNSAVFCAVFSPDGHSLFTSCWDGTVRHWDLAGCRLAARPMARIEAPDARRYLILTNQTIQVFDAIADQPVSQWRAAGVQHAGFNRSGDFVLVVGLDEGIRSEQRINYQVWEVKSGQAIGVGIRPPEPVLHAEVSDDGRLLAAVTSNHVRLWEVASGRELLATPHSGKSSIAKFSHDGSKLITANYGEVQIWETGTGRAFGRPLLQEIAGAVLQTPFAAFTRDDRQVITCCFDEAATKCFAQMWDVATGAPVGPRLYHDDGVLFADLSSDGKRLVTAGEDFVAKIWDLSNFKLQGRPLKQGGQIKSAVFDAPARMVLTGSDDYTARLWATDSGDPLTPPLRHNHKIVRANFVPGTQKIVTIGAASAGQTTVWTLPEERRPVADLLDLARLLTGDGIAPEGLEVNSLRTNSLAEVWQRLRAAYPEQFRVTPEAVDDWDRMLIGQAQKEADTAAVIFHVERLHHSRPDDPTVFDNLDLPVLERLCGKGPDDPLIAAAVQRARRIAESKAIEAAKAVPANSAP